MKNKYVPTAAGLYLNYMLHGMGVLLITLNMAHLQQQWSTDAAGVSIVISSLGIGKLATLLTGFLSDRFGRKPFIYLGILSYLLFLVGILLTKISMPPMSSVFWRAWRTVSSIPVLIRR